MKGRSPTLAVLALFAAGAVLANLVEYTLQATATGSAVAESSARLEDARLRLHRDGTVRYGADVAAMQFGEDGSVALESVSGLIRLGGRTVAFRSGSGAVGTGVSALELEEAVRLEMAAGEGDAQASVVHADSAVLHFEGGDGLRANGNVRINAGPATVEASALEWRPGEPLQLEGVRARIP